VETHCSTPGVDQALDELDVDLAMDAWYTDPDRLPADMPLADFENADGSLPHGNGREAA
jgi:hypothetical protein